MDHETDSAPFNDLRQYEDLSAAVNSERSDLSRFYYVIPILLIFGIIYACSLAFVYLEGDDARSIVFHALGRNTLLQSPYSPYHGMMDLLLRLVPANEPLLRGTAIAITSLSSVVMTILIIRLIQDLLPRISNLHFALIGAFILLCGPELFYLGMIYTPSLFAMCLVLAAHLLIRKAFGKYSGTVLRDNRFLPIFVFSALLFGIGVACRWDSGVYLLFLVSDLTLIDQIQRPIGKSFKLSLSWGLLAFAASIVSIFASGYGIRSIYETLNLAEKEVFNGDSWFATIGAYQTLFTPAFVIFFLAGWIFLLYRQKRLALLVLLGIIPVMPYLFNREPKMLLPAFPAFWLAIAAGIQLIWFANIQPRLRIAVRSAMTILIAAPWLLGLLVYSAETSWGPGFELRTADSFRTDSDSAKILTGPVTGRRLGIDSLKIRFRGGFAVPTPEGPRPIGGHAFVLINGEWRNLMINLDTERTSIVQQAMSRQINIVQEGGGALMTAKLLEMNFLTNDPKSGSYENGYRERVFYNPQGESVRIQALRNHEILFDKNQLVELIRANPSGEVIVYSNYSAVFRTLFTTAPESFHALGSYSAIVDLNALYSKLPDEE